MTDVKKTEGQHLEEQAELRQRQVETALRASEAKYRKLRESMRDAFVSVDMSGRIRDCNESFCRMLGYGMEELLALTFVDITPADWHPFEAEIIEEQVLSRGYSDTYEKEYRRKDGTVLPVELRIFLIRDDDGQPSAKWAIVRDITERKRAEAALQESQEELRQVASSISNYLWSATVDCSGKVTYRYYSPVVEQITGRPPAFYMSGPDAWLSTIYPDDRPQLVQAAARITSRQSSYESAEYRIVRPDGTIRWVQDKSTVRQMGDGNLRLYGTVSDITDHKRSELALRESEERYRKLAESTTDLIAIHDRNGTLLYGNPAGAAYFGIESESAVGMTQQELFSPEIVRKHTELIAKVFQTGEIFETDGAYPHGSGELWFNTRLIPLRDEHGHVTSVMSVSRNITQRKQAEEALKQAHDELEQRVEERTAELTHTNEQLRQSHNELQVIYDGVIDGILLADIETKQIVRTNSSMCRMLGYSEEQLLSMSVWDIHLPEDLASVSEAFRAFAEGRIAIFDDLVFLRRDGSVFCAQATGRAIVYKERPCVIGFFRDITERKRAEEALRQSEEKHRGLLEACPDAVVMADLNGKILFTSRQTRELVGLSDQEDLVGQSVFDYVIEDDRCRLAENIPRLLQSGVRRNIEYTVLCRDGTAVPTEISSALNRDAAGQPIAIMVVIRDITERMAVQAARQREHRTLKHLLQSSDHERQTIAYDIHDGLAQQLAGAIMQFDVYESLLEKKPNDAAKAYDAAKLLLQRGHTEARRLIAGIRHPVLDEAGVVEAVAHIINEQNREKGPEIAFHSIVQFSRLVPLLENAIYRIIQEGLTNACKYSKSDRIRITLLQQKDRLRIEIRDWGIGFNPKIVKECSYGLTGIRERAKLLGGKYRLHSAAGKGTRLVVGLPLMERDG
jgi:PAS domain S-box-containing protein